MAAPIWTDLPIRSTVVEVNWLAFPTLYKDLTNPLLALWNYAYGTAEGGTDLAALTIPTCVQDSGFWKDLAGHLAQLAGYGVSYADITEDIYGEKVGNGTVWPWRAHFHWAYLFPDVNGVVRSRIIQYADALLVEKGLSAHVFEDNQLTAASFYDGTSNPHGSIYDQNHCPKALNRMWAVLEIIRIDYSVSVYGHSTWTNPQGRSLYFDVSFGADEGGLTCSDIRDDAIAMFNGTPEDLWEYGDDTVIYPTRSFSAITRRGNTNDHEMQWSMESSNCKVAITGIPGGAGGVTHTVKLCSSLFHPYFWPITAVDEQDNAGYSEHDLMVLQSEGGVSGPYTSDKVMTSDACPVGPWDGAGLLMDPQNKTSGSSCSDREVSVTRSFTHPGFGGHIVELTPVAKEGTVSGTNMEEDPCDAPDGDGCNEDDEEWKYQDGNYLIIYHEATYTGTINYTGLTQIGASYQYRPFLIIRREA